MPDVVSHGEDLRDDEERPRCQRTIDLALPQNHRQRRANGIPLLRGQTPQAGTRRPGDGGEQAAQRPKFAKPIRRGVDQPQQHRQAQDHHLHAHRQRQEPRDIHRFAGAIVQQADGHAPSQAEAHETGNRHQRLPARVEAE